MEDEDKRILTKKIVKFISEVGLTIEESSLESNTFLPGIHVKEGAIAYDYEKLKFPGDLLHEAGHLALMSPDKRAIAEGDLEPGDGKRLNKDSLEVGVILWSYAALAHLKLRPEIVFHQEGYRGASNWYIDNFTTGNFIGLPLLQWMGLCASDEEGAGSKFPKMLKWVRGS